MGEIVKVHNIDRQSTPLFVNARRVDVPHNTDFPLADAYVEVLRNSRINFTSLGKVAEKKSAGYDPALANDDENQAGSAPASAARDPSIQVPGADSLDHKGAGVRRAGGALIVPPAAIDQVPGGDNLAHAGALGQGSRERREADAIDAAEEAATAAREGTQAPSVVIVHTGTNQDTTADLEAKRLAGASAELVDTKALEGSTAPSEPGRALADERALPSEPGLLDKSIPALTKALRREEDVAEIDRLIAAETGGKSRRGALEALATRRAEIAGE